MAHLRIGEPGRHLPAGDRSLDRLGPRTRVRIAEQRKGRHFTGTVASLAILLQNRQDVLTKGGGSSHRRPGGQKRNEGKSNHVDTSWVFPYYEAIVTESWTQWSVAQASGV